jgi:hypothetical protein
MFRYEVCSKALKGGDHQRATIAHVAQQSWENGLAHLTHWGQPPCGVFLLLKLLCTIAPCCFYVSVLRRAGLRHGLSHRLGSSCLCTHAQWGSPQ